MQNFLVMREENARLRIEARRVTAELEAAERESARLSAIAARREEEVSALRERVAAQRAKRHGKK